MPVLVGCGQAVRRPSEAPPRSPMAMMADASQIAAGDTGAAALWRDIDAVAVMRFIRDAPGMPPLPIGNYENPPGLLSRLLGVSPKRLCYGPTGGNSPQMMVNLTAEWIARGECDAVLLAGAECLRAIVKALKSGETLEWNDSDESGKDRLTDLEDGRDGASDMEKAHGLFPAATAYALFENALRQEARRAVKPHMEKIGRLMSPFSKIAENHPQAWFPQARSAEEIATPSPDNRFVGFPYTKYMNAVIQVDQSAALIMMSVEKARALGIPREKWIFLRGCADAWDVWHFSERENLAASPAMRLMTRKALEMARWSMEEVDYFDIYSCFPSAIQIAQQALGLAEDDPRPLTVTGGLPYFGGAGNNYAMHGIATMMQKLRQNPKAKGLCTANGYYVTKHAIGLYSAEAPQGAWAREDPASYKNDARKDGRVSVAPRPEGRGKAETWTVAHGRKGPETGIVIGRLEESGARFIANLPAKTETLRDMMEKDAFWRQGRVMPDPDRDGRNLFLPD